MAKTLFHRHRGLLLLLFAGLLTRLFASWALRQNLNLDAGVVTLMARHIALGKEYPVFFYGQPHMGSLEAYCSAFFCHIFGISGFAVSLGTAFVGFTILPIVYKWAAMAAGRRAGYMAVALLIIGPGGFFHYSASPRGAYASALTLGAFLVWFSTRMAIQWTQSHSQKGRDFLIFGFAAGLAWWSNQITTAAIVSAGLLLLATMQLRIFTWHIIPGIIGFFVGSYPFWHYNFHNHWASLSFGGTFGRVPFLQALIWLYTERFPSLILPNSQPFLLRAVVAALYLLLLGYAIFRLVRNPPDKPLAITLSGLGIFVALFSTIFSSSHFSAIPTPRYTLPLVAPLAVITAIAADQFARKFRQTSAWIAILYIISLQFYAVHWVIGFERKESALQKRIQETGQSLEQTGITKMYASLCHRAWNFALEERVIVSELQHNFYRPHEQQLEMSSKANFLENHGNPTQLSQDAGGNITNIAAAGHTMQQAVSPPTLDRQEIPPDHWQSAITSGGIDVRSALTDNTKHTRAVWRAELGTQSLLVTFHEPQIVQSARFTVPEIRHQTQNLSVDALTPEGEWVQLRNAAPLTYLFWSGTRPYWRGPFYRAELRFTPKTIQAIRFTNHTETEHNDWEIRSLQFFTPAPEQPTEAESLPDLLVWLNKEKITQLYADRWLANTVYRETDGNIVTSRDPHIFSEQPVLPIKAMRFTPSTAIVVLRENAPMLNRAVKNRMQLTKAANIGSWVVFRPLFPIPNQPIGLSWRGFSAIRDDAARAAALTHQAHEAIKQNRTNLAIQALSEAIVLNHTLYHERILLRELFQQTGDMDAAAQMDLEIQQRTPPADTFPPLRFENGVVLTGLEAHRKSTGQIQLIYYWQAPINMHFDNFAVFVHFLHNDQIINQDDHVFLQDLPPALLWQQEQTLYLAIPRNTTIPEKTDPTDVTIKIGLYDRVTGKRMRVRTELPNRRNATTLPVSLY